MSGSASQGAKGSVSGGACRLERMPGKVRGGACCRDMTRACQACSRPGSVSSGPNPQAPCMVVLAGTLRSCSRIGTSGS